MRPVSLLGLGAAAGCFAISTVALAGKPDAAKYPLRVHVFRYVVQPSHSREFKNPSDGSEYVAGMGQADLFENSDPRGFQFRYSCTVPMVASGGHETFPARWKKKDKALEILLPQAGKPWNQEGCDLQTEMQTGLVCAAESLDGEAQVRPGERQRGAGHGGTRLDGGERSVA